MNQQSNGQERVNPAPEQKRSSVTLFLTITVLALAFFGFVVVRTHRKTSMLLKPTEFKRLLIEHRRVEKERLKKKRIDVTIAGNIMEKLKPLLDIQAISEPLENALKATLGSSPNTEKAISSEVQKHIKELVKGFIETNFNEEVIAGRIHSEYRTFFFYYELKDPNEKMMEKYLPPIPQQGLSVFCLYDWLERREDIVHDHPRFVASLISNGLKAKDASSKGGSGTLELLLGVPNEQERKKIMLQISGQFIYGQRNLQDRIFSEIDKVLIQTYAKEFFDGDILKKGDIYLLLESGESVSIEGNISLFRKYYRCFQSLPESTPLIWIGICILALLSGLLNKGKDEIIDPIWGFIKKKFKRTR